jgi:hypothetical protein
MKPKLTKNLSEKEFKDYYWMKEEMVYLCRQFGLRMGGKKAEIKKRLEKYYETGKIPAEKAKLKIISKFDWNNAPLTLKTIISDNYKCSQHVRDFFKSEIGNHFHFNVELLQYMKKNVGKTLGDAKNEYLRIEAIKKSGKTKTRIDISCEYNQYIRDFFADNPGKTFKQAVGCWNQKKKKPGYRKYSKNDLKYLK